jgi:hypothetical protein
MKWLSRIRFSAFSLVPGLFPSLPALTLVPARFRSLPKSQRSKNLGWKLAIEIWQDDFPTPRT